MNKYTFLCEFQGGTYISQYNGESIADVLHMWIDNLDSNIFSKKIRDKIEKEFTNDIHIPVLLEGLENVWCSSITINHSLLLLNIVETV